MPKVMQIKVKEVSVRTLKVNGADYISITDIARKKNPVEPKDVVKNWMRLKNTLEYLGLWEQLNNLNFKGVEFDPLLKDAGSNAFTMSPSRWIEITGAIGIITKNGVGGGTYAQRDIAFKFASWVSVEFELYLVKEFQRLKEEEQKQLGWKCKTRTDKTQLPHSYRGYKAKSYSGRTHSGSNLSYLCQRGRCIKYGIVWSYR